MQEHFYKTTETNKLPHSPGVYRFINDEDTIIYVGKAKDLKKRVSSYFTKQSGHGRKTIKMVGEIVKIEITIVNSEFDALLLENSLIKNNQPKYNILLRDDKTYPFLCITNERFPRIFATRKVIKGAGEYFGPFAGVKSMYNVLDLIKKLYTIRNCRYVLSEENVAKKKYKICLEYHIGNCKGPCEGLQNEKEYLEDIQHAKEIIKGNLSIPKNWFHNKMEAAASKMAFEEAHQYKEKILSLEMYQSKSTVVNPKLSNIDVITISTDEQTAYVNYMQIKSGTIYLTATIELKRKLEDQDEEEMLL